MTTNEGGYMMYCPTCGAIATVELNYCKRCGSVLNAPLVETESAPVNLTGPTWAIGTTVMVVIAVLFGAITKLASLGVSAVALTWMVIAGLIAVVSLVALVFNQWSKMIEANKSHSKQLAARPPQSQPQFARPNVAGTLGEPVPSVTEGATRAFEPAYREPIKRDG